MTTTTPPTGAFRITPDDGSIYTFAIGRAPEFGNVQDHDLGQTVARSEGTKVYILGKSVEANVYRFKFRGLTSHEFHYLRLYVQDQLQGSKEKATFEWGRARNRILYSTDAQTSEIFNGWQKVGGALPVVNDLSIMSPEGFANGSSEVEFKGSGAGSTIRARDVFQDFIPSTGFVSFEFMAKVIDGGGTASLRVGGQSPDIDDVTIPDDGIGGAAAGGWYKVAGNYALGPVDWFQISTLDAASRDVGIDRVMATWNSNSPRPITFYDPVPLNTIDDARYVPDSIMGRQLQGDMWDVEFLVREEVA